MLYLDSFTQAVQCFCSVPWYKAQIILSLLFWFIFDRIYSSNSVWCFWVAYLFTIVCTIKIVFKTLPSIVGYIPIAVQFVWPFPYHKARMILSLHNCFMFHTDLFIEEFLLPSSLNSNEIQTIFTFGKAASLTFAEVSSVVLVKTQTYLAKKYRSKWIWWLRLWLYRTMILNAPITLLLTPTLYWFNPPVLNILQSTKHPPQYWTSSTVLNNLHSTEQPPQY